MNPDEFKRLLIEVLGGDSRKGRRWFFPKNVNKEYKVFANMTLKELVRYVGPAVLLSIGVAFIPPYSNVWFWIIKFILIVFIIVIPVFYANYRPVPHRDNIRMKDFVREYMQYKKSQKVFFLQPKQKAWEGKNN